jgi:enoyl-CoA hydratase
VEKRFSKLVLELRDDVAIVTFAQPERLNPLSATAYHELIAALEACEAHAGLRAVVLTGEGKAFVAGADIDGYADMDTPSFRAFLALARSCSRKLRTLAQPVIAAVNGWALGGGFELALCCDLIVASERARFGLPEAKLGLLPGNGGTQRLARVAGPQVARALTMTGDHLSAARAHELGLVYAVVEPDRLLDEALAVAARIGACGPAAVAMAKSLIDEGLDAPLETALTLEVEATAHLFASADGREGVRAFLDKRTPAFTGA